MTCITPLTVGMLGCKTMALTPLFLTYTKNKTDTL
jgi:hypothetical protein